MAQDSSLIRVAGTGNVRIADFGATLPDKDDTNPVDPAIAGFDEVGFVRDDGVKFRENVSKSGIKAWQSGGYDVRRLVDGYEAQIQFDLLQWTKTIVQHVLDAVVTAGATAGYEIAPTRDGSERNKSILVDWLDDTITYRLVIPKATLGDGGEQTFARSDAASLPTQFDILKVDSATMPFFWLTDDPAMA